MVKTIWKFWWLVGMITALITITVCAIAQLHDVWMPLLSLPLLAVCCGLGILMDRRNVLNEGSL